MITNSGPGTFQGSSSVLWVSSFTSQDSPGRSPLLLSLFQMCREDTSFAPGTRARRRPPAPTQEPELRGRKRRIQAWVGDTLPAPFVSGSPQTPPRSSGPPVSPFSPPPVGSPQPSPPTPGEKSGGRALAPRALRRVFS